MWPEPAAPYLVTITGKMPALEEPADVVTIELGEMAFVMPDTISAGPAIWKLTNTGAQPHHLILFQMPDGITEEQAGELFGTMFGPPAASPAADDTPAQAPLSFEDLTEVFGALFLSGGQSNWLDVDLAAGSYLAVCFLPDAETGAPHVALGMPRTFIVE